MQGTGTRWLRCERSEPRNHHPSGPLSVHRHASDRCLHRPSGGAVSVSAAPRWLGVMTAATTPRHRVSSATARMRDLADTVVHASMWSMDPAETAATLVELTRLEAQVCELRARVAAHADDLHVGQDVGVSSAANWLAHQTKATRPAAHGTVKLGHSLEEHTLTRDALAAG